MAVSKQDIEELKRISTNGNDIIKVTMNRVLRGIADLERQILNLNNEKKKLELENQALRNKLNPEGQ